MVMLLASLFSVLVPTARAEINPPVMISPGVWETPGTWVIEPGDSVVHGNKTIYVNGNLVIQGQGALVLYNVDLIINTTLPGEFYIEVQPGGTFLVYDGGDGLTPQDVGDTDSSFVMSPDPSDPFLFYIRAGGTFLLNRSHVLYCGLPPVGNPTWGDDYGIYSESDLTMIEDSVVRMNGVGLVANHSRATVTRTWIFDSGFGVVGAENALLDFSDVEIVWSMSEGVFLNGSRMYLNDSFIVRNGMGPGVNGIYAYRGSTLVVDRCDIMQNAANGAIAAGSTMTVTSSWIFENGGAGLVWSSPVGVDIVATAADNWIEGQNTALRVSPTLGAADSHIEFHRNNITINDVGTSVEGMNITGNFTGNTLWSGTNGLIVDGDSVDMDISKNVLDDHSGDSIRILSDLSGIANLELNRINNTYGSGSHGIYVEPQQFADVSFANNTITNVSGPGIAVYSNLNAYIISWSYNNTIISSSTDCSPNTCGAMYFYSSGGDLEVYAYENSIFGCADAGILAISDFGSVLADVRNNTLVDTGFMAMFWPASILVLANTGTAQFDILNNTIRTTPNFGIVAAAWAGIRGSVSGNILVDIGFWSIYAVAGDGDVNINCSYNRGDVIGGGIYSDSMAGDADITLRNNMFSTWAEGLWLEFPSGNVTLSAHSNDVSWGPFRSLHINAGGWLDAVLNNNLFFGGSVDNSVYVVTGDQANLTMLNNRIGYARNDGFHLEAPSANLINEWNYFQDSRVNFNVSTTDPYGHLYVDSFFDFFTNSVGSFPARVWAEGTSDMFWDRTYSLYNDAEVEFILNRTADVTIRNGWINSNDATGWEIWHNSELLTLGVESSVFRENQRGLFVVSSADAVISATSSVFNVNTGTGLELFIMGNLTLSTSSNEFSSNTGNGLNAFAFGNVDYTGSDDAFALNQFGGLYLGSTGTQAQASLTGSDFIGNSMGGGIAGAMLDFFTALDTTITLSDILAIGNGMIGVFMNRGNVSISDVVIQGHEYGIYASNTDAVVQSSQIDMNNNSLFLFSTAHFIVFNSTLASNSIVDFILDTNSTLWGINTTFNINDGMFLDALSWAKRSWYTDIEVTTNVASPLAGVFVDAVDTFGTPYINGTTGADGFLRLNLVDDQWRNAITAIHYNPYDITGNAPGVGTAMRTYSFYAYVHLVLVIWDIDGPIANAGPDQLVDEDTVVQFDGTGSTDNVIIQTYVWTFTDQGLPVTLSGVAPTYTFAEPGVYTVTLEVADWSNPPATDTVQITVLDVTPPNADAGPDQNVPSPTMVLFDGSFSTDNVGVVNYTWTFTYNATPITLYGMNPTFTFWTPGSYVVILNVRDNASNGGADNMVVTVFDADPPVANAGPDQMVDEDTVVTFDGSGSTDNVGIVYHKWTFQEGANVVILEDISPTYVFTEPGLYTVTLEVSDDAGFTDLDTMNVTVLDATPPTVIFTSPYDTATDQPLTTSVVIGFSEPMDTISVESSITISSGAQIMAYNWNAQDDTVTLTLSNLTYSSMYVVNVNATATDASGISMISAYFFNFMTTASAGPDTISPEVVYSYPEDGAVDVPRVVVLKVVFSEPMNMIMTEGAILVDGASPLGFNWLSNSSLVEITVAPFWYSTVHTLTVSTTATDAAGNPLSAAYSATFTIEDQPPVDIVPPEVIYTDPEEGKLGVPTTASVYLVFSEPMNTDSVEALGVVTITPAVGATNYYWTHNDTVLELQFVSLVEATTYTVTVTTGAEDMEGNFMSADFTLNFTTVTPSGDVTPPTVVYTTPEDGDTDTPVATNVVIVFSEAMNTTSVEAAISISGGITPTGFQWMSGDTSVRILLPTLNYTESYTVTIADTAKDPEENTLAAEYIVGFTTESAPGVDATPPEVTSTYPENNQQDVPVFENTMTIVVVFSEPMDESSVEAAIDMSSGTVDNYDWSADSTTLHILLVDVSYDAPYTLTISSGAEDLAGNSLSQETVDFTTMAKPEGPPAGAAEFDIAQAWWLILIIIILIVIVVLLLLMKRGSSTPIEEPVTTEEPMPDEEVPEPEEPLPGESPEPLEPPAPEEPSLDDEVPVY
jgi:PKD repeat protein